MSAYHLRLDIGSTVTHFVPVDTTTHRGWRYKYLTSAPDSARGVIDLEREQR